MSVWICPGKSEKIFESLGVKHGGKCILEVQDAEIVGRRRNKGKKGLGIWDYWVKGDNSSMNKSQVLTQVVGVI